MPVFLLMVLFAASPATADQLTITAPEGRYTIGDEVLLSGTAAKSNIIAVYLFVTGPGLDTRGVCLENLNLPAGQGYFTSAFVNPDGTWHYAWNTAFLTGRLMPGTYTIYVVNVPLGLNRLGKTAMAKTNVTFTGRKELELAADNLIPCIGGLLIAGLILVRIKRV